MIIAKKSRYVIAKLGDFPGKRWKAILSIYDIIRKYENKRMDKDYKMVAKEVAVKIHNQTDEYQTFLTREEQDKLIDIAHEFGDLSEKSYDNPDDFDNKFNKVLKKLYAFGDEYGIWIGG